MEIVSSTHIRISINPAVKGSDTDLMKLEISLYKKNVDTRSFEGHCITNFCLTYSNIPVVITSAEAQNYSSCPASYEDHSLRHMTLPRLDSASKLFRVVRLVSWAIGMLP